MITHVNFQLRRTIAKNSVHWFQWKTYKCNINDKVCWNKSKINIYKKTSQNSRLTHEFKATPENFKNLGLTKQSTPKFLVPLVFCFYSFSGKLCYKSIIVTLLWVWFICRLEAVILLLELKERISLIWVITFSKYYLFHMLMDRKNVKSLVKRLLNPLPFCIFVVLNFDLLILLSLSSNFIF